MATPPKTRRRVLLPRPLVEPISSVQADFTRSAGFYVRVSLLGAAALLLFAILGLRLWSLQVIQGPRYARLARAQTFRYVDEPTARAPIVDRHGRVLAGADGQVVLAAEQAALGNLDEHGRWHASARGMQMLTRVARVTHVRRPTLIRRIREAVVRSPYAPAVVLSRIGPSVSSFFDERANEFPGFHVAVLPDRSYPEGALGSEFLGLLGEVSAAQLKDPRYRGYRAGEVIGQSGVEATYDRLLNGGFDRARVAVDSAGRTVGPLRFLHRSTPQHELQLTIDARLQRAAQKAIQDGIAAAHANGHADADGGAAIAINPRTGEIYALASYPDFSQVAAARNRGYLARLLEPSSGGPSLLNRATQGLYPTGSTFKPIVAEAAMQAGLISPESVLWCTGSLTVGGVVFHNVEAYANEPMTLHTALAQSCDTWFYRVGTMFYGLQQRNGSLAMQTWAKRLGLGHPTGVDVPGEAAGVVPTPQWLKQTAKEPWQRIWYEGYSVNLAIGQGQLAVTPLQLAVAYSALANGGTVVTPHVGRAVLGPHGELLKKLRFKPRAHLHLKDLSAIRQGLYEAAHSSIGTSSAVFGDFPIPVAGKTGTAETPHGHSDHSWYASWAPVNNPRLVVVVVIEHGGFGAEAAAPAAKEIYSAFFHVKG